MTRRRERCVVCDYTPANFAGWWTFVPLICCESESTPKKMAHKRTAKK